MVNEFLHDRFRINIALANGRCVYGHYPSIFKLASDTRIYDVGFDQSTSQTGVAIKTTDGRLVALIDFANDNLPDTATYTFMLSEMLVKLFTGAKLRYVVLEKPYGGKSQYSRAKLEALKSYLEGLRFTIPAFASAKFGQIYPSVWRKHYLPKKRYSGQLRGKKVKKAAVDEGILRYPILQKYGQYYSHDSFDALGILDGYLAENNIANSASGETPSIRKISKTMEMGIGHNYIWETMCVKASEFPNIVIKNLKEEIAVRGYEFMEYNTEMNFAENCQRATNSSNRVIIAPIPRIKEYILFNWRRGKVIANDEIYVCVAYRENLKEGLN